MIQQGPPFSFVFKFVLTGRRLERSPVNQIAFADRSIGYEAPDVYWKTATFLVVIMFSEVKMRKNVDTKLKVRPQKEQTEY